MAKNDEPARKLRSIALAPSYFYEKYGYFCPNAIKKYIAFAGRSGPASRGQGIAEVPGWGLVRPASVALRMAAQRGIIVPPFSPSRVIVSRSFRRWSTDLTPISFSRHRPDDSLFEAHPGMRPGMIKTIEYPASKALGTHDRRACLDSGAACNTAKCNSRVSRCFFLPPPNVFPNVAKNPRAPAPIKPMGPI